MTTRPEYITKAVILARGLGKRMRAAGPPTQLAPGQALRVNTGMKAMISVGRPFLDFVLSALADAGFTEACLVVGPEHTAIREYYASIAARRIRVSFAIQEHPLGTANALLSARSFAAGESFLALNSDNYYPVEVLTAMRTLGEPGLAAFERESLVRLGNIPSDRTRDYALLNIGASGCLEGVVEKPDQLPVVDEELFISMNCWRFDAAIFRACEEVPRSARGEFELPGAVQYGIRSLGLRFKAVPFRAGVLDLSYRSDIAEVAKRLAGVRAEL
jgi:dTDP-glucose pyrophosphorylase